MAICPTVGMMNSGVINVEGGIRLNTPICGGCPGFPDSPEAQAEAVRFQVRFADLATLNVDAAAADHLREEKASTPHVSVDRVA